MKRQTAEKHLEPLKALRLITDYKFFEPHNTCGVKFIRLRYGWRSSAQVWVSGGDAAVHKLLRAMLLEKGCP